MQVATRDLVNYFRTMSGVAPVRFDPDLSQRAQQAALIGYATGSLSHAPTSHATCWSPAGAEAAASSNLGLGYAGADVVRGYMDDAGPGNRAAGHRWWIQRPATRSMGSGTLGSANALWVDGPASITTARRYTSWPSAGYLPATLEPHGRWSFTAWDRRQSLDRASVTVTGPDGALIAVHQEPVDPTFGSLVFELPPLANPTGATADAYTVTVSGILDGGEAVGPHRYRVLLFDPDARARPGREKPSTRSPSRWWERPSP